MDDNPQSRKSIASGTIAINNNKSTKPVASSPPPKENKKDTNTTPVKTTTFTPPEPSTTNKPISSSSSNNTSQLPPISPVTNPPPQYTPPPYNPPNQNMGYNDPYGNNWNNQPNNQWGGSYNPPAGGQQNLTMEQKVDVIKNIFKEVVGRDATDKDINYYKYGIVTEDSLRKKLTTGKEHSDLIKNGNAYKSTKEAYDELLLRVKQYEAKIKDHIEEFKKMKIVFDEKNRYIQHLRAKVKEYPEYSTQPVYGMGTINQQDKPQPPSNNLQPIGSSAGQPQLQPSKSHNSSGLFTQSLKDFIKSLFDF